MSSSRDPLLQIELRIPASHPQLLEGLDIWLRMGLISDAKVRQICQTYLVCAVVLQTQLQPQIEYQPQEVLTTSSTLKPFIATLPPEPQTPPQPNFITSMLQSLGEELSVRWLLFLGVFLVVLSSGVLAASQWEKFPAIGQYGVLLAYTLTFGGFTFWAGKQDNLKLTAQTLLIVTWLLVPVNFWAMDSFNLWNNTINWLLLAIASLFLSTITVLLAKNRTIINNFPSGKLPFLNILSLSYLHWGWKISGFPLIAVYIAMVGTTLITVYQKLKQPRENTNTQDNTQDDNWGVGIYFAVVTYGLLGLLFRAIFVAGVNITQLGLAIGICGWLAVWLSAKNSTSTPSIAAIWEKIGVILLFLGWLVSVFTQPEQAIIISGLSLWVFSQRLQIHNSKFDLTAIFFIGLQTTWLAWRLVPETLQQFIINTATYLTHSQNQPLTLLSIALFPYLILMLIFSEKLHHDEKEELAIFGKQLTLLLGVCLTMFALVNSTLLTFNLLFSSIILAIVTKRHTFIPHLVYLTHTTGILTVFSAINWLSPNLNQEIWAVILLTFMVAEWVFSVGAGIWKRSAWYIGLALATLSFTWLLFNVQSSFYNVIDTSKYWGVIWLITPLALTGLAIRTHDEQHRTVNTFLSVLSVITAQFLTLPLTEIRLIGLGVGVGVMFVNTRYLRKQETAALTISFGLSFIAALLWNIPNLALSVWFLVSSFAIFTLWLGRTILLRKNTELTLIYAAASDKWAIALSIIELIGITLHSFLVYTGNSNAEIFYLLATSITLAAIIYRTYQQPTNWAFYSIGWCLELLVAEILGFGEPSIIKIGIANIALGLITQLFGEWWRRKYQAQYQNIPQSFHILPIIYGAFSVILRFNTFTDWTGLYSLGIALILVGVGRRREEFKPLLYFGIIGISISAYELLFYQMSQSTGGALGDGLIAMSALGTSIMYAYRILSPWLINYFCLTPGELKNIAHLHWFWSSILLLVAVTVPTEINLYAAIGTGIFLTRYGIWQGRRNNIQENVQENVHEPVQTIGNIGKDEIWVYLGLLTAGITGIYLQNLPISSFLTQQLTPWNGVLSCLIAYFIYIIPWENLGWSKTPWQRTSYILPLIIIGTTQQQIYPLTLTIAAFYYIFLSKITRQIRFTYISLVLINWALFNWFMQLNLKDSLWYITSISLSILYTAQIDPQLKPQELKPIRHFIRTIGSGLVCTWSILFYQHLPYIPGIFSLIAIFAGLALKIRAFLYVGTATFIITSIYQLVIFSLSYSFLKWIIGLLVGILLIYIAANFETRRTQITSLLRSSIEKFQQWE
ncbi:DUF2157 domain-containing protein [Sphaerospermopsis torques-reginae]|uniref:DUF2157 domain-containing protein n=1 Tax=Sphaerospermopsis torques-reginae ITEP-024 TaxID=984208 RepID=A0ABX8X2Z3_9CYAN|nr:DUF2157 domain-containing protein [Sphaerospermopsis torques-reginae]QYX33057.1 DUF2157 domain-containing protein [Sphaerospermopsis torques-reginae ITEP-024]